MIKDEKYKPDVSSEEAIAIYKVDDLFSSFFALANKLEHVDSLHPRPNNVRIPAPRSSIILYRLHR